MHERPACFTLLSIPTAQPVDGAPAGFGGVAYSGGVIPNHGWAGNMAIDLASISVPDSEVSVLLNHDADKIVGRARIRNTGGALEIESGRYSAVTEHGREVAALMAEGHPWKLSIGVNGRLVMSGERVRMNVNGRDMELDSVFRDTRLLEVSFVPAGADPNAYAAQLSARLGINDKEEGMNELEQARARVAELEAQVQALTAERDTARAELTAAAQARRGDQIAALFGADASLTDEQRAAYIAMTDVQFAAVEAALQAERRTADPALFRQSATAGRVEASAPVRTFSAPAGFSVDGERAKLHAKALAYAAANKTDYMTAAIAVEQGA